MDDLREQESVDKEGPDLNRTILYVDSPARRCLGITKAGKPCGFTPVKGEFTCINHGENAGTYRARARQNKAERYRERKEGREFTLRQGLSSASEASSRKIIDVLLELLDDPSSIVRLRAVEALLDRQLGRPRQDTVHVVAGAPRYASREDAAALLASLGGG